MLEAGESFAVPPTATAPTLTTAKAEALRITVGTATAPPVGPAATRVSNVSLLGPALLKGPAARRRRPGHRRATAPGRSPGAAPGRAGANPRGEQQRRARRPDPMIARSIQALVSGRGPSSPPTPIPTGFAMRLPLFALSATALALTAAPAAAQRQTTPEQRIDRLEKQVRQMSRQVFPKGQPADTAGFSDEPAASLTQANQLSARLDAIESQMAQVVRASEENGNRLATMEAELARLRADQDRRLRAIETGSGDGPATASDTDQPVESDEPPPAPRPRTETPRSTSAAAIDGAEAAYDAGFRLWEAKKYDSAIAALRKMIAAYPDHRRVSWANNLIGRAWLDKGQYRTAAEVLLANYRANKAGERAPDSLYYLGQASMKLGQPTQACKAYAELENEYGSNIRPALRTLLPAARAEAKCR